MEVPSNETEQTATRKTERPLEDILDDLIQATEELKAGVLDIKELDEAERAMVENFAKESRQVFVGFLNSLKPEQPS